VNTEDTFFSSPGMLFQLSIIL